METIIEQNMISRDGVRLIFYSYTSSSNRRNRLGKKPHLLILCPAFFFSARSMITHLKSFSDLSGIDLITLEWRGHGSRKVGKNELTVHELANDLNDLISYIRRETIVTPDTAISLLGNSMGVNVMWRYIDLFGEAEIDRLVFVDQPAAITGAKNPSESKYPSTWSVHSKFVAHILSWLCYFKDILIVPFLRIRKPTWMSDDDVNFMATSDGPALGRLLLDTTSTDNCGRLALINRPCLVYGGQASFVHPEVCTWIAHRVSGPSRLIIYPVPYGTHSPFIAGMAAAEGKVGKDRFACDVTRFFDEDEGELRRQGKSYIDKSDKFEHSCF